MDQPIFITVQRPDGQVLYRLAKHPQMGWEIMLTLLARHLPPGWPENKIIGAYQIIIDIPAEE